MSSRYGSVHSTLRVQVSCGTKFLSSSIYIKAKAFKIVLVFFTHANFYFTIIHIFFMQKLIVFQHRFQPLFLFQTKVKLIFNYVFNMSFFYAFDPGTYTARKVK